MESDEDAPEEVSSKKTLPLAIKAQVTEAPVPPAPPKAVHKYLAHVEEEVHEESQQETMQPMPIPTRYRPVPKVSRNAQRMRKKIKL